MTFEEIFKEKGLYVTDGFAEGFCIRITENNDLKFISFDNKNSIIENEHNINIYGGLFKKDYRKVYTRQSLFK